MLTIQKIEEEFEKKFHDNEVDGFVDNTTDEIKSFYRHQILALLREVEGRIPKEKRINKSNKYKADDRRHQYGYNSALSDIKAILKEMMKEVER